MPMKAILLLTFILKDPVEPTQAYLAFFVQDPAEKEEKMKEVLGKVSQGFLRLEKVLAGKGGQFFAANALTWADLHFLQFVDLAKTMSKNDQILDPTPKL